MRLKEARLEQACVDQFHRFNSHVPASLPCHHRQTGGKIYCTPIMGTFGRIEGRGVDDREGSKGCNDEIMKMKRMEKRL